MENKDLWAEFVRTPPSLVSTPPCLLSGVINHTLQNPQMINLNDPEVSVILGNIGMEEYRKSKTPPSSLLVPKNISIDIQSAPESRCLLVSNVPHRVLESDIRSFFDSNGSLYSIIMDEIDIGNVVLKFYDLKQAYQAKHKMDGSLFFGNIISVSFIQDYQVIDPHHPPNLGTIAVFQMAPATKEVYIQSHFSQYGEIKQIRIPSLNGGQAYIEYWDIRDAKRAQKAMNGKHFMGKRIAIQFALPPGYKKLSFNQ